MSQNMLQGNRELTTVVGHFDTPLSVMVRTIRIVSKSTKREETKVQFSRSVVSDSLRPLNRSTPGLPVHHQLPEFNQTRICQVSNAIQPSHPPLSPSPTAPNASQHQSFSSESTLRRRWPKYWNSALASFLPKKSQG